jgi:hypothetical protein
VINPTVQEGRFEDITEGRPAWYHLGTRFPGVNSSCGRAVGAAVGRVSSAGERFALPHSDNSPPRSDDLPLKRRYPFRGRPSVITGRENHAPHIPRPRTDCPGEPHDPAPRGFYESLPARQGDPRDRRIPSPAQMASNSHQTVSGTEDPRRRDTIGVPWGEAANCGRATFGPNPTGHLSQAARKIGVNHVCYHS